ncbi:MAG: hypothetical protein V2I40_00720 [Desulfobacteraceae bacterium]|jgi:hypothetical protein|nr:hypothetical protein [Desulfobacteraceae bacterium]
MADMLTRDITGKCEGECRDRVLEGEMERQASIAATPYNEPDPESPPWTRKRNEQPGIYGGRV